MKGTKLVENRSVPYKTDCVYNLLQMNFPPVEGVPVLRHVSPEEGPVLEDVVHLVLYLVDTATASGARRQKGRDSIKNILALVFGFWLHQI